MKACIIEHCPNEGRPRSPYCLACASSFRYWDKRGPGAILARQDTLEKWQDRMQYLGDSDRNFKRIARRIASRRK